MATDSAPSSSNTPHLSANLAADLGQSARTVYDYLALSIAPAEGQLADAVIGFGHFDLRIAERCLQIRKLGLARSIIFTGGIGAGSADLRRPEAEEFLATALRLHPDFRKEDFIIETRSTNTGENVRYTTELLRSTYPALSFGTGIRSAILVATPVRMRRVWLTVRALQPDTEAWCLPPESDLHTDCALFNSKNQDLIAQLPGEIERLATYPDKGWIVREQIPASVLEAARLIASQRKL